MKLLRLLLCFFVCVSSCSERSDKGAILIKPDPFDPPFSSSQAEFDGGKGTVTEVDNLVADTEYCHVTILRDSGKTISAFMAEKDGPKEGVRVWIRFHGYTFCGNDDGPPVYSGWVPYAEKIE